MNEAGDMESFNNIKPWLSEIDIYASDKVCKLLVGKKCDLVDSKVVHTEKAKWHKSADIVSSRAKNCVKIAQLCVDADQHRRPTIDNIIDMLNLKESLKDNNQVFSQEKKRSNSIQLPTMDPGETHFTSKILCNDTTSKVTDIYSLEFCFPFEPNKRLHCPMTLTNMTNHYVGVWITPISANLGVNKSFEDPCSFFLMKPNSTWIVTLAMKEHAQQQLPSQDTRKFKMVIVIMELEIDHLKLESPYGSLASKYQLLKLVIEESQGKLTKAMVSAAIDNTVNCKIVTIHQAMSPRMSEDGFCMALDVHPIEPWIIMGHDGGLVSIWNYKTQQMVKEAFKMTTRGVCSVKFITRDQSFAVAVGDTKGWVHIFNNSPSQGNKKIESFKAHPDKCVDSLAVHPTCPILLSSSCEDNMVKRWDWHQGWACTRIFEGHTSGVRCLTFNPRDANIFASIGVADDTKVWNINSSNAITLPTKKVDYFFSDRRNFLISCDDDQIETAEIWDMQTKDHLRTLGVFMRRKLLKNGAGVDDHDRGNSSKQKSGHGSEILAPGPINKANVIKNNGNKDSGTKENQGGRGTGDDANNVTGAGGRRGAGHPAGSKGKGQTGASAPTSTPIGHTSSSMPSGPLPPPGTATAGLYSQSGGIATYIYDNIFMDPFQNSMFRDDNVNLFSDENPNSCSVT